jgi:hypothetical protein
VVPDGAKANGQKGKVLVIPHTADTAVRDATLTIGAANSTWTIDSQAASVTDKPATVTDKPATGTEKPASGTEKPASGTEKPASGTEKPASGTEKPVGPIPCGDLVLCATTATSLTFSSCAAAAVACEPKRPNGLVSTHTLNHGDEKGIKLFPLTGDVLYGTDTANAYVVLVPKEKVLVAPLNKKTDATALDVDLKGTVWTSKRDNPMMWIIIIIGSLAGLFVILIFAVLFLSGKPQKEPIWPRYRPSRSRIYPDVGPAADAAAATTASTATSMSPVPP